MNLALKITSHINVKDFKLGKKGVTKQNNKIKSPILLKDRPLSWVVLPDKRKNQKKKKKKMLSTVGNITAKNTLHIYQLQESLLATT